MNEEVVSEIADRGKRDLFFLMSTILGSVYGDLTETTHRPLCDFFVKKNPNKSFAYQDTIKNRLLMAPRGVFKTSTDLVDCISWMLNFPNVTIMMLSGSQEVATRMVEELKEIFLSCTDFQELYPDFIPTENIKEFGAKGEFWLPRKVRTRIRREPTLMISTLDSVKASIHVDIKKGDDVCNEVNSKTATSNEKVANDWDATRPLLNPGGYNELIGTYYDFSCLYGKILDRLKLSDELRFGYPLCETRKGWKVAVYPALTPDENGNIFNPEGIFFPEKFCIHVNSDPEKFNLEEAWDENSEHFNAQYMNHPKGTSQDYFPMELLKRQTISLDKVPMNATSFGVWDLAYSNNRGTDFTGRSKSDFTVGAMGAFDQNNNIYVFDLFRGRFDPPAIINKFVEAWKKWPLQRQGIEKAAGHPLLGPGLSAKMRDLGILIPVDWIKVPRSKDSVINEILSLSSLLQQGKLWFVDSLPYLAELYVEFNRFGKYTHDDICRAVSLLLFYLGKAQVLENPRELEPVEIGGAMAYGDAPCGAGIVA
jgi:predicted phage terminase large subunit-like protein